MASCSSGDAGGGKDEVYLTVHFDDGPERGLLAEVAQDDLCDPQYWRFEEVHGGKPRAKVLFPEGNALYIAEPPSTPDGTLIDEDGDPHSFVREEGSSPGDQESSPPAATAVTAASLGQRHGPGGWRHVELEPMDATEALAEEAQDQGGLFVMPGKRRRRPAAGGGDSDEDWVEPKSLRRATKRRKRRPRVVEDEEDEPQTMVEARQAAPSNREDKPIAEVEAGHDRVLTEASEPEGEEDLAAPPPVSPDAAEPPMEAAVAHGGATMTISARETSPMSLAAADLSADAAAAAPVEADLDEGGDLEKDSPEAVAEASTSTAGAPPGHVEGDDSIAGDGAVAAGSLGSSMSFGRAKTARAVCRSCGEGIQRDEFRYGMRGYAGGRSATFFAHVRCFQERLTVEYCPARRGKCKGSGVAFEPGDVRIGFDIGGHKSWWSPAEAARWTSPAVAEGQELPALDCIQALEEEHRGPLLALLRQRVAPSCELRRAVKARSRGQGSRRRTTPAPSAASDAPPPGTAAGAPATAASTAAGDMTGAASTAAGDITGQAAAFSREPLQAALPGSGADDGDSDLEVQREEVRHLGPPLDLDDEGSEAELNVGYASTMPRILDDDSDLEVAPAS